jgi:hypothetical protein
MNRDALISQVNAIRNQAISLVQQAEAILQTVGEDVTPAVPTCVACGGTEFLKAKGVLICKACSHNQPA